MEVIPAIDIRGGKCVRLYQGDYNQETIFSEDPLAVALDWRSLGARRLHVVDLDGAGSGEVCNMAVIEAIVKDIGLPVQLGGGIRAGGAERGVLLLRTEIVVPVKLAGGCLIEPYLGVYLPYCLQYSDYAQPGDFPGANGLLEGSPDKALGRQVIYFVGLG